MEKSAQWWCARNELSLPDIESDLYRTYRRVSVQYLTGELSNRDHLSVIGYATSIGALPMLRVILHTTNIYSFDTSTRTMYDVTNMTPKSLVLVGGNARSRRFTLLGAGVKKKALEAARHSRVGIAPPPYDEVDLPDVGVVVRSVLDILVGMEDEKTATEILDMAPIRQLVQNYWSSYQWLFFMLMSIHIMYMVLFSVYYLPYTTILYVNSTAVLNPVTGMTRGVGNYLLLLWPVPLLLFECYNLVMAVGMRVCVQRDGVGVVWACLREAGNAPHVLYANLTHVVCFSFGVLVVLFVVETERGDRTASLYLLAGSMFVGWLFSIVYTRGFETVSNTQ